MRPSNVPFPVPPARRRSGGRARAVLGLVVAALTCGLLVPTIRPLQAQSQAIRAQGAIEADAFVGDGSQLRNVDAETLGGVGLEVLATPRLRRFFLTKDDFGATAALTACDAGFHMATLWEIFELSNLHYDGDVGRIGEDSFRGVPTGAPGWIRTGGKPTVLEGPGAANCNLWASDLFDHAGTILLLSTNWSSLDSPWKASAASCSAALPVWCVETLPE